MGCGTSRSTATGMAVYREQSEFDTCSTVILPKDTRGEPDGQEVVAEKTNINEYNDRRTNHVVTTKAWTQPSRKPKKSKGSHTAAKKAHGTSNEQLDGFSILSKTGNDKGKQNVKEKPVAKATDINGDLIS